MFYLGFARESVNMPFLIPNVSAGKITCRGHHFAGELRVGYTCLRMLGLIAHLQATVKKAAVNRILMLNFSILVKP